MEHTVWIMAITFVICAFPLMGSSWQSQGKRVCLEFAFILSRYNFLPLAQIISSYSFWQLPWQSPPFTYWSWRISNGCSGGISNGAPQGGGKLHSVHQQRRVTTVAWDLKIFSLLVTLMCGCAQSGAKLGDMPLPRAYLLRHWKNRNKINVTYHAWLVLHHSSPLLKCVTTTMKS